MRFPAVLRPKSGFQCNACRMHFDPVPTETVDASGVVGGFTCPHCRTGYESYRIDSTGLAIRRELQAANARGDQGAIDRLTGRLGPHVTKGRGRIS
jgi:hypothetical protein